MHQQIRLSAPASSPPNLERALEILSSFNLIAVGGSNVEHGGEFAFAVDHDQQDAVVQALRDNHIQHRVVDVTVCWLDNRPGALLECLRGANGQNRPAKLVRDITVGIPDDQGRVPVQIFFDRPG